MSDAVPWHQTLAELEQRFAQELAAAHTAQAVEQLRIAYLGRKSPLALSMKQLGSLPESDRAACGKRLNELKQQLEGQLTDAAQRIGRSTAPAAVDVTLPGIGGPVGRRHPVSATIDDIRAAFRPLGFEVVDGPELELEFYNFDALNIPRDHPSREAFDTFFVNAPSPQPRHGKLLLRSHTSPVQIRVMEQRTPPLRILVPGRVYRPDPLDASHSFMFHQVEGLVVDDRVTFADLKGLLTRCLRSLFGEATRLRFRPHFFPFTEPSAEVDITCVRCGGARCSTCGHKGWLEILGCGVVHPRVFNAVGYNPARVQGVAFGMGVERIAMLRHGITDIRLFYESDVRFLEQF